MPERPNPKSRLSMVAHRRLRDDRSVAETIVRRQACSKV
jgi:hypothetical protein